MWKNRGECFIFALKSKMARTHPASDGYSYAPIFHSLAVFECKYITLALNFQALPLNFNIF